MDNSMNVAAGAAINLKQASKHTRNTSQGIDTEATPSNTGNFVTPVRTGQNLMNQSRILSSGNKYDGLSCKFQTLNINT
jgi:hypothetical protein